MNEFTVNYSWLDRLVHNLAMSQFEIQKSLSRIEDKNFNKTNQHITAKDPILITSLPRAGTTLLLEIFTEIPDFVSHTYRDMPFLLCPLTWSILSGRFQVNAEQHERAHGDGMLVSFDSVEAFEEVLWRAFWTEHFEIKRILPWKPDEEDERDEFTAFMRQHMRKLIFLGQRKNKLNSSCRYVSKNNANISRLGWIERHFPDAAILIPYRQPFAHISSLLRQHNNFLDAHSNDKFILRYMESIGHFEFGKALRPIDFDNWLEINSALKPTTLDFWAEYWIVAFKSIIKTVTTRTTIFSYDHLCMKPSVGLEALEERVGLESGSLSASASRFRAPTKYQMDSMDITPERKRRIKDVLEQVEAVSLF